MKHYEKLNSGTDTYIFIFDNYEKLDEQYNEIINDDRYIDIFTSSPIIKNINIE